MNFLEICKAVRVLSGTQGTGPSSVTSASGYEVALVSFVRDAWIDIQSYRDEWDFLKDSGSFFTVASQDNYTVANIFGVGEDHKKWDKDSFIITDGARKHKLIKYSLDYVEQRYLNDDSEGRPTIVALDTDESVLLKITPDKIYNVDFKYWKQPQILSADTDVPLCNTSFHNLIIYKALEKMSIYLSSPEIYRNYSTEAARMLAQLMRLSNPAKKIKNRRRTFA